MKFSRATNISGHEKIVSRFEQAEGSLKKLPESYVIKSDDYFANYRSGHRDWSSIAQKASMLVEDYIPPVGTLVESEALGRDEPDIFYKVLAKCAYPSSSIDGNTYGVDCKLLLVRTKAKQLKRKVIKIKMKLYKYPSGYEADYDVSVKYYASRVSQSAYFARKRREKAEKQATPSWANWSKIREIYQERDTLNQIHGKNSYHVDHIIPLQGDTVCGLHWHKNLCIETREDNLAKSNKLDYRIHF